MSDGCAMRVRHAPLPPCIQPLWAQPEVSAQDIEADVLQDRVMSVGLGHGPWYQRSVYTSRGHTFIGVAAALMHKLRVAKDPEFGERLRHLIPLAGFKNPRRFAIDGMGWPPEAGPQRLNEYLKGRIPEVETLVQMAERLNTSVADMLGLHSPNSVPDEGLKGILRHLLELEGIHPDKADTIASALLGAQRLLSAFPDEEPLPTRAKYAARAAWLQQRPPLPGR